MRAIGKNEDRDKMAVELYFSVLRIKKSKGLSHKEAKDCAYDAVELRYNISPKRLQNIIYDNHNTLNCDKTLFVEENKRLLDRSDFISGTQLSSIYFADFFSPFSFLYNSFP